MWSEKFTVGEMSVRGNVLVGKFPVGEVSFGELSGRGIVRSGNCPFGEMSIREVSVGELSSRGTVCIPRSLVNFCQRVSPGPPFAKN